MELREFFRKYRENIEILEVISKSYYYSCENIDRAILSDNKIMIENLSITLEGEPQIKEEVNNEQKIYIYLYKNFALKFTMKKILS